MLLLLLTASASARDVTLFAGLGALGSDAAVADEYAHFANYSLQGALSTASLLLYGISNTSHIMPLQRNTTLHQSDAAVQRAMQHSLGLRAMPLVYCDATVGADCAVPPSDVDAFVDAAVALTLAEGWDGLIVDLEKPGTVTSAVTAFVITWGRRMVLAGLAPLGVWVDGAGAFNMTELQEAADAGVLTLHTMLTYYEDGTCADFIAAASRAFGGGRVGGASRAYGVLTRAGAQMRQQARRNYVEPSAATTRCVVRWMLSNDVGGISVWASMMASAWVSGALLFLNG